MRTLLGATLLAVVLILGAGSAFGDERVILRRDDFGEDLDFIDRFLARSFPDSYRPNEDFYSGWLTVKHILVGRHDITGDGVAELFVYIAHTGWCARNDCELHVFENRAGMWLRAVNESISTGTDWIEGERIDILNVWVDPKTGSKTVHGSNSGFRLTGSSYMRIGDAGILELQAQSFDFAGMDRHFAPGRDGLDPSGFDPDKVGDETDWNRGSLRHLAPLVGTHRYGAVINDPAIWAALGGIMDRDELAYAILFMERPIRYDRGYLVLEGSRIGPTFDNWGNETVRTAMIVADTRDGSVHAGTRRDRDRSIYSLAKSYAGLPPPFYEWLHYGERSDFLHGLDQGINATWVRKPQAPE